MGSYRSIIIGPPEAVNDLSQEVCEYISKKDTIKNRIDFEHISIDAARRILTYDEFHDSYPYLYQFSEHDLSEYLDFLEDEGYNKIKGEGIWFVCYNHSPEGEIEERRTEIIRYIIEDDGDRGTTPFSYDPNQDYVTEM